MDLRLHQWYEANSLRKYPFHDDAIVTANTGVALPNDWLADGIIYSFEPQVTLIRIDYAAATKTLTLVFSDGAQSVIDLADTVTTYWPVTNFNQQRGFFITYRAAAGQVLTSDATHTFIDCHLAPAAMILLPSVVYSLGDGAKQLTGVVKLLAGSGIHITRTDNELELSAFYDKDDCTPTRTNCLKTINGVTPNTAGELGIQAQDILYLSTSDATINLYTALTDDKLCPTKFAPGLEGPPGPTGLTGNAGKGGPCVQTYSICCNCEVCDGAQACTTCQQCNTGQVCYTCEVCNTVQSVVVPPCSIAQQLCSYLDQPVPEECDLSGYSDDYGTLNIDQNTIRFNDDPTRDDAFIYQTGQVFNFDYSVNEPFAHLRTEDYLFSPSDTLSEWFAVLYARFTKPANPDIYVPFLIYRKCKLEYLNSIKTLSWDHSGDYIVDPNVNESDGIGYYFKIYVPSQATFGKNFDFIIDAAHCQPCLVYENIDFFAYQNKAFPLASYNVIYDNGTIYSSNFVGPNNSSPTQLFSEALMRYAGNFNDLTYTYAGDTNSGVGLVFFNKTDHKKTAMFWPNNFPRLFWRSGAQEGSLENGSRGGIITKPEMGFDLIGRYYHDRGVYDTNASIVRFYNSDWFTSNGYSQLSPPYGKMMAFTAELNGVIADRTPVSPNTDCVAYVEANISGVEAAPAVYACQTLVTNNFNFYGDVANSVYYITSQLVFAEVVEKFSNTVTVTRKHRIITPGVMSYGLGE